MIWNSDEENVTASLPRGNQVELRNNKISICNNKIIIRAATTSEIKEINNIELITLKCELMAAIFSRFGNNYLVCFPRSNTVLH